MCLILDGVVVGKIYVLLLTTPVGAKEGIVPVEPPVCTVDHNPCNLNVTVLLVLVKVGNNATPAASVVSVTVPIVTNAFTNGCVTGGNVGPLLNTESDLRVTVNVSITL